MFLIIKQINLYIHNEQKNKLLFTPYLNYNFYYF